MKKIRLLAVLLCLLLTACAAGKPAASQSISSGRSAPASSSPPSLPVSNPAPVPSSSLAPVVSETIEDERLLGSWERVSGQEGDQNRFYFRLTFSPDGTMEYIAGWYLSEIAEILQGTYTLTGNGEMRLDLVSTMEESAYTMQTTLRYTLQNGQLAITLVSGDAMHIEQQEGVEEVYTPFSG